MRTAGHVRRFEHAQRRAIDRGLGERDAAAELLLEDGGQRRGLIDVTCLRQIPADQLDVAQPAAERRQPLGAARRRGLARRFVERRRRRSTRRSPIAGTMRSACRLMNRSALLLLAIAVRSSIGTLRSSSRVSSTRMPSRPSIAAFTRRDDD